MTVYRYTAVPIQRDGPDARQTGEIAGTSPAEVRDSLRRVGLQVLRLRAVGAGARREARPAAWQSMRSSYQGHLRRRRRQLRAEICDGLATMLTSGLPLLEATDTMLRSSRTRRTAARSMLVQLREALRSGSSLGEAMAQHPSWFEPTEVAMVMAAQHAGSLPEVLRSLADRHQEGDQLTQRLIGALTYPVIVSLVGLGVVVFLSVKTLPDLVRILETSGVETPALTQAIISFGQFVAGGWWMLPIATTAVLLGSIVIRGYLIRRDRSRWLARVTPAVLRRVAVSRLSIQLAELIRAGIPIVEALRVLAPTVSSMALRQLVSQAADRAERGDELSAALDDERWFDAEYRRVLDVGQSTGELDDLLERIGERYGRQASRLIDRLATLLEPAVILGLAILVGVVVLATVLPLLRIREML